MLPKKGRKEITVDGVLYYYVVKPCISLIILNSETLKVTKWYEEFKRKWNTQMTPSWVAEIIREKAA